MKCKSKTIAPSWLGMEFPFPIIFFKEVTSGYLYGTNFSPIMKVKNYKSCKHYHLESHLNFKWYSITIYFTYMFFSTYSHAKIDNWNGENEIAFLTYAWFNFNSIKSILYK